ncbi:methyltransferase [Acholeplasma hippikon]|uniref:Methyltransferase n=1 Tax=Acholeplasma hippikon TaxID=264636 RepID=A0A449BKI6_9MOLU|nr:methyltransferase [Acholeplasma hippikon]
MLGTKLNIESEIGKAFNLDTIVISDFARIPKGSKLVCDFGCGNAAIMLYLSQKTKAKILGIELQESRYLQAKKNIILNHLENQLDCLNIDLKTLNLEQKADVIVSNPPFFKVNKETKRSMDLDMEIAKHELFLTLEDLVLAARKNIKHGGLFFMVHKADRLDEIIINLTKYDFRIKRIRFVHPTITSKPNQVLIEARFKGEGYLIVEPPLIQYKNKTEYSDEMQAIYQGRSYLNESSK